MKRNPAAHAAHDELLLARLYGGDLEGRELERAREMTALCPECAAVLGDFGVIAAATAALPVPPRPRDFTIGAARARTLHRGRGAARPTGVRALLGRLGPVRSLGASMAAAGVAGILAVGVLSTFGPMGTASITGRQADGPVAAEAGSGASKQPVVLDASHEPAAEPTEPTVPVAVQSDPQKDATATNQTDLAEASSVPDGQYGAQGEGTNGGQPPTSPESGAPWPLLFGGLAAGGLILLAVPAAGRRYSSRRR